MLNLTGNQEEASERIDYEKEVKKAQREAVLTDVKQQAQIMSDTQAQIVLENISKVVKEEGKIGQAKVAAASLRRNLVNEGITPQAAVEKIQALTSLRSDVVGRVKSVIRLAKIRRAMTNNEFMQRADKITRFYATLQDGQTFQLGEILPSAEIAQRVKDVAAACGVPEALTPYTIQEKRQHRKAKKKPDERHDSDKKIVKLIGNMFLLKNRNRMIEGIKTDCKEFLAFNDVELADFVPIAPQQEQSEQPENAPTGDENNPLDLLADGVKVGYVGRELGQSLRWRFENGVLSSKELTETILGLKATYDLELEW